MLSRRTPSAILVALTLCLTGSPNVVAQDLVTKASRALLMDFDSGAVLFEKAGDERFAPASLAKLMTAEYLFHEIEEGRLSESDAFTISEEAWRRGGAPSGGSSMFAEVDSRVDLGSLLRGLIVDSGNDAAIAIAEGIAGNESAFADRLSRRATELGLLGSSFRNATGAPDPKQFVTARDLAALAHHIITSHPRLYPIFAEPEFVWNKIRQTNRNKLLDNGIGVDGLSSGYLEEVGYGIVASAVRNNRRLVLVLSGLVSAEDREAEAVKFFDWGFRSAALAAADAPAEHESAGDKAANLPPSSAEESTPTASEVPSLGRRVALVIGNSDYEAVPKLPNPGLDAAAIAAALKRLAFEVVVLSENLDNAGMRRALGDFSDVAVGADWAVVYFAGHGIEVDGENYLIPVDARLERDKDVAFEAVSLSNVVSAVEDADLLRLVIVDACRDNPFAAQMQRTGRFRSASRGLARPDREAFGATVIAYAAGAGELAEDGDQGNSPYVTTLLKYLEQPGLEIGRLFRRVRADVLELTDGRQEPATYGEFPPDDLFFLPGPG